LNKISTYEILLALK